MNKDYLEYQYSKSKKLTERAFKLRIGMLMVSILACAGIMASSAFALFTCDINRSTTLTAADFKVLEFNPIQMQSDEQNVTNVIHIVTTPGVLGYCKIPVYGTDNTTRYYYTEPFVGEIYFKIATAVGTGIGKPEAFWGNPRNVLDPEIELLGIGASVVHSYAAPEPEGETSGGGEEQDVSQEQQDNETDNTPTGDETENNDEIIKAPMLSVSPSVNKEQTTVTESVGTENVTTSVVEKNETTVTPSVTEENASVENSNSTVAEAPVTSTPTSDNSSDSDMADSSGTNATASNDVNSSENSSSGDNGGSFGSVSSGSDASTGEITSSSSNDGGE